MSKFSHKKTAIANEIARYESSICYFETRLENEHKGENAIIAKIAQAKEELSLINPDTDLTVPQRAYLISKIEGLNYSLARSKENIDHIEDAIFALNEHIEVLRRKILNM